MPKSIIDEYRSLVEKFLKGDASANEEKVLERYYNLFRDEPEFTSSMSENAVSTFIDDLHLKFKSKIAERTRILPIYKKTWFRVAAAVVFCFSVSFIIYQNRKTDVLYTANEKSSDKGIRVTNHFLMLSDGSRVLLHAGSKLELAKSFNKGTREVDLIGEAYFDVKHDSNSPFIIHTGQIKTTVLGTAFNIMAYPQEKHVTVTVKRGRVKVENGYILLAVLTPNKQLVAEFSKDRPSITQDVVAQKAVEWAKTDMSFESLPFRELVKHLNERYAVHITLKNPGLGGCPITGRFNGTESLEEVLQILSEIRNTSYKINGKEVIIDGQSCN